MAVASHAASMQRAAISDSSVSRGAESLTFGPSCPSSLGLEGALQLLRQRVRKGKLRELESRKVSKLAGARHVLSWGTYWGTYLGRWLHRYMGTSIYTVSSQGFVKKMR